MSGKALPYVSFFIALFLIFPIYISANIFYDVKKNRLFFGVYLFKVFKIYSGYAQLAAAGVVFHLSKQKAVILPYDKVFESGKKFEITKGFEIIRYRQITEYGNSGDAATPLYVCSILQIVSGIVYGARKTRKPFTDIKSTTMLVENEDVLKISLSLLAVFNMVVLIVAGAKLILEKLYNGKRKQHKNR